MTYLENLLKTVKELDRAATPGPMIIQRFDWEGGDLSSGDDIYKAEIAREARLRVEELCKERGYE